MLVYVSLKSGTIDTKSIIIDIPGVEFQGNFFVYFGISFLQETYYFSNQQIYTYINMNIY